MHFKYINRYCWLKEFVLHVYFFVRAFFFFLIAIFLIHLFTFNKLEIMISLFLYWIYCSLWNFWGWTGIGHELIHNSVFKKKKINRFYLWVVSLLSLSNPALFRATHFAHHKAPHSDIDLESPLKYDAVNNVDKFSIFVAIFDLKKFCNVFKYLWKNSNGDIPVANLQQFVIAQGRMAEVNLNARLILTYVFFIIGLSIYFQTINFILFLILPNFISTKLAKSLGKLQHPTKKSLRLAGIRYLNYVNRKIVVESLEDDVVANRLDIKLPFYISFFYANMNFHASHHIDPSCPFYLLSKRSKENTLKSDVVEAEIDDFRVLALSFRGC